MVKNPYELTCINIHAPERGMSVYNLTIEACVRFHFNSRCIRQGWKHAGYIPQSIWEHTTPLPDYLIFTERYYYRTF